ncbi:hypothetical protein [Urbifossiella limnaea]|uniref:Uncharacterized protein n=1 Tax=Urbifossiella limnaea TaxID=2528023 RepID=A0A517XW42_9BACT|nr:hypothetical protein [Urbifossiella limnaea]QDU21728.1 hypothetical protein ETAA1_37010 [Urbifossiella limnaea]
MTGVVRTQLTGLAATIAGLKERVRVAVAGELGRAVSGAVQQVVQAVVSGRADPPPSRHAPQRGWDDAEEDDARWGRPRDAWDEDRDEDDGYDRERQRATPVRPDESPDAIPAVTTAVAAGLYAAKWWVGRKGTLLAAAGLGLGVGLLGVLGGPVARTAVAVLAAAADLLAAADALGDGAARLEHL